VRGLALWREWDSTLDVPRRFAPELNDIKRSDLAGMSREQLEELAWRLHELARLLANRAGEDSSTSSRPPSSDDPYRREERGKPVAVDPDGAAADSSDTAPEKAGKPDQNKTAKGSGKQPGAKGHWRCQPIVVSGEVAHAPMVCAACGAALGPDLKRRCVSAHDSLELVRGDMALQVTATRHSYFAVRCACGHDNVERPRVAIMHLTERAHPDTALEGQAGADVSAALIDLKTKAATLCFSSQQDALDYASHIGEDRTCRLLARSLDALDCYLKGQVTAYICVRSRFSNHQCHLAFRSVPADVGVVCACPPIFARVIPVECGNSVADLEGDNATMFLGVTETSGGTCLNQSLNKKVLSSSKSPSSKTRRNSHPSEASPWIECGMPPGKYQRSPAATSSTKFRP